MDKEPTIAMDLLRVYFKSEEVKTKDKHVKVKLNSEYPFMAFEVSINIKTPGTKGSYPQRRYALERHDEFGHEGIHLQIWYHQVASAMNIGRIYVSIDAHNNKDLRNIAEGFIYSLYETFLAMGEDYPEIAEELFYVEQVKDLKKKKGILIMKIKDSLERKLVEISRSDTKEPMLITPKQIRKMLESHGELVPFFKDAVK